MSESLFWRKDLLIQKRTHGVKQEWNAVLKERFTDQKLIHCMILECWVTGPKSESVNERKVNPCLFKRCWNKRSESWSCIDAQTEWESNESQSGPKFTDSKRFTDPKTDSLNTMGVNLISEGKLRGLNIDLVNDQEVNLHSYKKMC